MGEGWLGTLANISLVPRLEPSRARPYPSGFKKTIAQDLFNPTRGTLWRPYPKYTMRTTTSELIGTKMLKTPRR